MKYIRREVFEQMAIICNEDGVVVGAKDGLKHLIGTKMSFDCETKTEEKRMSKITVTKERIKHLMDTAQYDVKTVFGKCTIVTAQLENGFIMVESSACVDPANYDPAMGERICKDKIRDRLWELEGYALQKAIHKLTQEV